MGLGNLLYSDDGVGIRALQLLEEDPRLPPGTQLLDGGTLGVQLAAYFDGHSRLLLLDAVDVGAKPGTVVLLQKEELLKLPGGKTAHDLCLPELLAALRLLDQEPRQTLLLGMQPESTIPGIKLSPAVERALPHLVDKSVRVLRDESTSHANIQPMLAN